MAQRECPVCGRLMQGDRCPWFPHRTFTRPEKRAPRMPQDVVYEARPKKTQAAPRRSSGSSLCRYGRHPRLAPGRCQACKNEASARFKASPKYQTARANRLSRPELRARLG